MHVALDALDPRSLLSAVGAFGVFLVLFAETGLLIGFFLPGDSLLFTAGLLCTTSATATVHLSLPTVLLAAVAGALTGAQVGYLIGKRAGPRLLDRPDRPTAILALTATAAPPVREEIVERLGLRDPAVLVRGFDRPNIRLAVERFHGEQGAERRGQQRHLEAVEDQRHPRGDQLEVRTEVLEEADHSIHQGITSDALGAPARPVGGRAGTVRGKGPGSLQGGQITRAEDLGSHLRDGGDRVVGKIKLDSLSA